MANAPPRRLHDLTARAIVAAIAAAARRWSDADFPPRVRATGEIVRRTAYAEPVVDFALDRLFEALSEGSLTAAITGELGSLAALDGFVERPGRAAGRAAGIGRVAIVASDTTIGVALPAAVFALCAKCSVAVRDRSDALCAAFRDTLGEEREELAEAFTVYRAGQDDAAWRTTVAHADAVVAFGGDDALRTIRSTAAPQARFIPFGHRTSVGYIAREALAEATAPALAAGAARDALLYDGDGCLSMHALFVESGGALAVDRFAALLAEALEGTAVEFPATKALPPPAVAAYRDAAAFRAALGNGAVYAQVGAPHVLVLEPARDEPPPLLARTLAVYAVDGPAAVQSIVRDHHLALEAVALAPAGRSDVVDAFIALGAVRFAPFGALQAPPLSSEHGGVGRIAPFVRWVTREA